MTTLVIDIEGMTCGKCTSRVQSALEELGDFPVSVDLDENRALIELDDAEAANDDLRADITGAIEEAGYDVVGKPHELDEDSAEATDPTAEDDHEPPSFNLPAPEASGDIDVDVRGMTCASCVSRVEKALGEMPGVERAVVNFATEVATVAFEEGEDARQRYDDVRQAVEEAGYDVAGIHGEDDESEGRSESAAALPGGDRVSDRRREEARQWRRRWVVGLLLSVPIIGVQMGPMWAGIELAANIDAWRFALLAYLTGIVMVYVGRPYYEGAWKNLKHFNANMDTLVGLGAGVAFTYSAIITVLALLGFHHGEVYFDGAAMILTLISVGKWLEARAKGKAGEALEALLDLAAKSATVQRGDGWVEVPVNELQKGDVMLIRPGEKIPTDGVVVDGRADVDEAMITGESVPVTREEGDEVIGSTINQDGRLEVRATNVGSETALAQIIDQVESAQASKADVQRLADRVSSVFVPVIILIAIVTFCAWWFVSGSVGIAVLPAVAVLIVACPCALGLATPTAIMVGTSKAASHGVLIREAQALERARDINAIIFDKTGTLTTGRMEVTDIVAVADEDEETVLRWAASLEDSSEHPIGRAIVRAAKDRELDLADDEEFQNVSGSGVEATLDGTRFRVGKPAWIGVEGDAESRATELMSHGKTVVVLAREDDVIALIAVRDAIKEDAREVVQKLQEQKVAVWMITGDNAETAAAVGEEVGIDEDHIRANVRPEDKADAVRDLQADGERVVAMVGDGVNDAPALAQADLGIAIGSGTDVAIQTADITLVSESLHAVSRAIAISRATYRKILQNLFWAFIYNTALVPVAALGFLQPIFAAGAMAISSVSVVSNSLLLKRRSID